MKLRNTSYFLLLLPLLLSLGSMGQTLQEDLQKEDLDHYCHTDQVHKKLMKRASQKEVDAIRQAEQRLRHRAKNSTEDQRSGHDYTIPVVFHVIHANGPENLPRENLKNALDILNRDFRKNNADTSDIVNAFDHLASDIEVEFRLAQKDPQGNCHSGVTRTYSQKTYDGDRQMKYLIQWDPSMYLNVWVCNNIGGNAAGYTIKPADAEIYPALDGIVVKYNFLGSLSPSSVGRSRTLTHEVGHYLNLDHPWGSCGNPGDPSNCTGSNCGSSTCSLPNGSTGKYDDDICDTPHTVGWTTCNLSGSSCGTLDNVQNYMSYSYCSRMFTQDQKTWMRSALTSSIADRNNLWTNSNLQATGVAGGDILCEADFQANRTVLCEGGSVQFTDFSFHNPTSWSWQFPGATTTSSNVQNPQVTYPDTGTYDVTLTAQNANGTETLTLQDHIEVIPSTGPPLPWVDDLDYMDFASTFGEHPDYFVKNLEGDSTKWEHTEQVGEGGSNGCVMLENHNNTGGEVDIFTTNTMDASQIPGGNLELSFDVAYSRLSSGDQGTLKVYASDDCGASWSVRGTYTASDLETASPQASPFFPNQNQWAHKTINTSLVSIYNVENLRFKFEFISDGGNNLFIDNINVHDQQNVGIEERSEKKAIWVLQPNPAGERASLKLDLPQEEKVSVKILDLRGKTVRSIKEEEELSHGSHRIELDLNGLEAGPYFIKVKAGEHRSTKKLFKR